MPNHLRPWIFAFGTISAMIVAVFLLQSQFLPTSSSFVMETLPEDQQHTYTWDKMSDLLSEMQQNITVSVLNAVNLGSRYMDDAASKSAFDTQATPPFWEAMAQFPWAEAVKALDDRDQARINDNFQQLLDALVPYLILSPSEGKKDASCKLPEFSPEVDCSQYPTAFTGAKRQKLAKVAHALQLGFDADVLEIQLNELDLVADKIFIVESTHTHNKNLRKPLLWDRIKSQSRFRPFSEKIVHIVVDDVDVLAGEQQSVWGLELLQEKTRWEAFLAWNNRTGDFFGPDDLVGFGDTDEIPSSHNIHLLKHCEMAGPSVDIGSWFSWGKLDRAFGPDWPVPNNPWTLGDPTYWTLRSAKEYADASAYTKREPPQSDYPSRMRGKSGHYLLGGIHMTDSLYPPFSIAKFITCTECGEQSTITVRQLYDCFIGDACLEMGNKERLRKLTTILDRSAVFAGRIMDVSSVKKDVGKAYYVPWYLKCHSDRFPTWFGELDWRDVGAAERKDTAFETKWSEKEASAV